MLPKPFPLSAALTELHKQIEETYAGELRALYEQRTDLNKKITELEAVAEKASTRWWQKVVREMKSIGVKFNPSIGAGFYHNVKRNQVEFIDEHDLFLHHIANKSEEEQKLLYMKYGPHLKREIPSQEKISEIVEDLLACIFSNKDSNEERTK